MNTPFLLISATLLFWGWQTGHLIFGLLMAFLVEAPRRLKARWEFSEEDFFRIWDLCTVLFFGGAIFAWSSNDGVKAFGAFMQASTFAGRTTALNQAAQSAFIFVQWLPIVFFPMAAAQAWSARDKTDYAVFSWWLRRQRAKALEKGLVPSGGGLNVGWPYFALTIIAASAANLESIAYFAGATVLLLWAFWANRSPRYRLGAWAALAAVAVALAYFGQRTLHTMQKTVENWQAEWMTGLSRQQFASDQSHTAIGQIGRLKLSGKIVLRVKPGPGHPAPNLLRETSHNIFRSPVWSSASPARDFASTFGEKNDSTWILLPERTNSGVVTVSRYLDGGRGLLALPMGAERIDNLPIAEMRTNRLGTVTVSEGPGLAVYDAIYQSGASIDEPPDPNRERSSDLDVPANERGPLQKIVQDLNLRNLSPPEALKAVERFFELKFRYSTWQGTEGLAKAGQTALGRFLLTTRAGHCEYFATATVLLLRTAGIPARYAVGWSVQERSGREFVVRGRHAHAWCLAWVNGAWQDLDTTPGTWLAAEEKNASMWEPFSDLMSKGWYQFQKFRWGKSSLREYVPGLLLLLLAGIVVRLFWKNQWKRRQSTATAQPVSPDWPGLDSEFFQLERLLSARGFGRTRDETFSMWLDRLEEAEIPIDELSPALALHNRYRFDPAGLTAAEREELRSSLQGYSARGDFTVKQTRRRP